MDATTSAAGRLWQQRAAELTRDNALRSAQAARRAADRRGRGRNPGIAADLALAGPAA